MKKILQNTFRFIVMLFILNVGKANAITYTFIGPGMDYYNSANWQSGLAPSSAIGPYGINASDIVNINAPCQHDPLAPSFIGLVNSGVINVNSSLYLLGGMGPFGIENYGTINVLSAGTFGSSGAVINNGTINNSGTIENFILTNNASAVFNNNAIANNISMVNEVNGIINNNVGGTFTDGFVINNAQFNNYGTSTYSFSDFTNNPLGVFTNSGNFTTGSLFINSGIIDNSATINNTGVLRNNGTISGFNGTVNGAITTTSTSTLNPLLIGGAGAFITINNPSTLQNFNNTVINLSIHSTLNYNNIVLSGNASLNGATINVTLDPAYVPANGDVFTFIDANSFTTTSPTLNLPVIPGFTWSTTYLSGNLVSTLNASIVLPITLKQLTVKELSFGNQLNWEVENHTNFSHFEIEKSYNAKQFDKIGSVTISQENNYQFQDLNVKEGVTYYRLKLVDIDGAYTFSNIVTVNSTISNDLIVVNNPVKEGAALQVISKSAFKVYALNGSEIKNLSSLSSGIYIITNADGQSTKFVVE